MTSAELHSLLQRAAGLIDAGRYAEAEPVLNAAYTLVPASDHAGAERIAKALAAARTNLGRVVDAVTTFRRYAQIHEPACDPQFDELYDAGLVATGTFCFPARRRLRFYSLIGELDATLPLDGRVAECGCFRGLSSYLLNSYLKLYDEHFDGSGFDIFDSFQGLSAPEAEDAIPPDWPEADRLGRMSGPGVFSASEALVREHLKAFPGIAFHAGWIPDTFAGLAEQRYRFVHVDVDLHGPTYACLEYFYPRLVPGGKIVCDDYNWPGARRAIEDYAQQNALDLRVTAYEQAVLSRCS